MQIKRLPITAALIFASFLPATVAAQAGIPLPPEIRAALLRAQVPAEALAVVVQELGPEPRAALPRLAWQSALPLQPASLMKLLTTGAALDLLGPAWTWNTPVWLNGRLQDGVLEGDLVIRGSGDPTLVVERVWLLLRRVRQLGVREIRGDIVLDRSAFSPPPRQPQDFDGEPSRPYNVGPDALLLNYKAVSLTFTPEPLRQVARVTVDPPLAGVEVPTEVALLDGDCGDWQTALQPDVGSAERMRFNGVYRSGCGERRWSLAYADPASYNGRLLRALWQELGGSLAGQVRDGMAPSTPASFEFASPPLAEAIRDINKFSNNVMAEQLYLSLGLIRQGSGTPQAAHDTLQQWLRDRLGDTAEGTLIENGSGLSRQSRLTAQTLVQLLRSHWSGPYMSELMSSLPASGLDGTLRRARAVAPGQAHLKTGSLRDVLGVAGYVLGNSGRYYAVAVLINHANAAAGRPVLEAVMHWTASDLGLPLNALPPQASAGRTKR